MILNLFRVLGNSTRVQILASLGKSDKTVSELIATCSLSQSAVSQHLAYLKKHGLVAARRRGRYQIYHVSDKRLPSVCNQIMAMLPEVTKFK